MRRTPQSASFLAHLPLFRGLRPAEIARIAAGTTRRELARGETLFRRGDPNTGFHAVVYGTIALHAPSADGVERLADVVSPGESFGEAVMFLDKPYIVTARAQTDALVLHIDKAAVFAALEHNPALARRIIASLADKLHASIRERESRRRSSGAGRFAAWLARLVPPAQTGRATVALPGTKREVAARLDMSAEHLSRVLGRLSAEGLISVRGRSVGIPDVARLREWAAKP
jgi:CRP-like cAMP-binding protein